MVFSSGVCEYLWGQEVFGVQVCVIISRVRKCMVFSSGVCEHLSGQEVYGVQVCVNISGVRKCMVFRQEVCGVQTGSVRCSGVCSALIM